MEGSAEKVDAGGGGDGRRSWKGVSERSELTSSVRLRSCVPHAHPHPLAMSTILESRLRPHDYIPVQCPQ